MEISKLYELCMQDRAIKAATGHGEWLIALHSTLSSAEQQTVFERPPDGVHQTRPVCLEAGFAVHPAAEERLMPRGHPCFQKVLGGAAVLA